MSLSSTTGGCIPNYQSPYTSGTITQYFPWTIEVDKTKKAIGVIQKLMDAGFLKPDLTVKEFIQLLDLISE